MSTPLFPHHDPFTTTFGKAVPFEREYEGWVMKSIEDYFRELGLEFSYMAVPSSVEKAEGLDEFIKLGGKYFGLQFKRPSLTSSPLYRAHKRLEWKISKRSGQHKKIMERSHIFYALPTFLNRDLRGVSLSHVFFWREGLKDGERLFYSPNREKLLYPIPSISRVSKSIFLDESDQRVLHQIREPIKVQSAFRWGRFAEGLLNCSIGMRTDDESLGLFEESLAALHSQSPASDNSENDPESVTTYACRITPKR